MLKISFGCTLAAFIACLGLMGCSGEPSDPVAEEQRMVAMLQSDLPSNVTNVTVLGNDWFTFNWESKRFLAKKNRTKAGYEVYTFTELRD